jgi:hypothetical protein
MEVTVVRANNAGETLGGGHNGRAHAIQVEIGQTAEGGKWPVN